MCTIANYHDIQAQDIQPGELVTDGQTGYEAFKYNF